MVHVLKIELAEWDGGLVCFSGAGGQLVLENVDLHLRRKGAKDSLLCRQAVEEQRAAACT